MRNTGLEEAQAGIKIAGRNINNLRYADDTPLMAESEEELKSLLMKVKEEREKVKMRRENALLVSLFILNWAILIFSRGRSGGLVFPSRSEFSTVYCDPHSQRLWHSQ